MAASLALSSLAYGNVAPRFFAHYSGITFVILLSICVYTLLYGFWHSSLGSLTYSIYGPWSCKYPRNQLQSGGLIRAGFLE